MNYVSQMTNEIIAVLKDVNANAQIELQDNFYKDIWKSGSQLLLTVDAWKVCYNM